MPTLFNFLISLIFFCSFGLAHAEPNLKEIEQNLSDSVITTKIAAQFTQNPELNVLKISVTTNDGVVTLSGNVNTKSAFVNALKVAKETKGVKMVIAHELIIKQVNLALTDAYITAKVEAAVLAAKVLDDESIPLVGINASTANGTVTLSGKVKAKKSIELIIKRVNAIDGVKKLISKLQVSPEHSG
ncbi:MAG: BON domain-containing protein [Tatlockia sp.]|nr:BON domain-containing protein [Tatlockia sp.]